MSIILSSGLFTIKNNFQIKLWIFRESLKETNAKKKEEKTANRPKKKAWV